MLCGCRTRVCKAFEWNTAAFLIGSRDFFLVSSLAFSFGFTIALLTPPSISSCFRFIYFCITKNVRSSIVNRVSDISFLSFSFFILQSLWCVYKRTLSMIIIAVDFMLIKWFNVYLFNSLTFLMELNSLFDSEVVKIIFTSVCVEHYEKTRWTE